MGLDGPQGRTGLGQTLVFPARWRKSHKAGGRGGAIGTIGTGVADDIYFCILFRKGLHCEPVVGSIPVPNQHELHCESIWLLFQQFGTATWQKASWHLQRRWGHQENL